MAQITDVMDALAVFDAAHQELSWAYSGDFNDIPETYVVGLVHTCLSGNLYHAKNTVPYLLKIHRVMCLHIIVEYPISNYRLF